MPLTSNTCCYRNCYKHRLKDRDITYFKFPTKDKDRTRVWQTNCGNIEVALLNVNELRQLKICERHFMRSQLIMSSKRKLLVQSAVPNRFDQKDNQEEPAAPVIPPKEVKTYSRKTNRNEAEVGGSSSSRSDSDTSVLSYVKSEPQSPVSETGSENVTNEPTIKTSTTMLSVSETKIEVCKDEALEETYKTTKRRKIHSAASERFLRKNNEEELAVAVNPLKELRTYSRKKTSEEFDVGGSESSHVKSEPPSPKNEYDEETAASEDTLNIPTTISETKVNICKDEIRESKYEVTWQKTYMVRKRRKAFSNTTVIDNLLKYKSEVVKTFIKMQLFHSRNSKWRKSEMQLALSIFRKSPNAYSFLLEKCKFSLPSVRAVRSWLQVHRLKTAGAKANLSNTNVKTIKVEH